MEQRVDDPALHPDLDCLDHLHRQGAAALNRGEMLGGEPSLAQWRGENVGGGNRVLHREVDADAADRRHRVRRIADAQQPGPPPLGQPIDRDGQQFDVVPVLQLLDPIGEVRRQPDDLGAESVEAARAHLVVAALADHKGALPVIAAIERHQQMAEIEKAAGLLRIAWMPRQPHP